MTRWVLALLIEIFREGWAQKSQDAMAYLASLEVVAASALYGHIAGPGWYQKPDGVERAKVAATKRSIRL